MKMLLHVGCGNKRKDRTTRGFNTDDWWEIRLDIDSSVNPDVIGTVSDMSGVATASVDAVFSSHNIEHLYPHEVPKAMEEFLRVLKPEGFAVVTCPDLRSICARIAEDKLLDTLYQSAMGPITPLDVMFGHRGSIAAGNLHMAHHTGYTKTSLTETLTRAGFKSVAAMERPAHFDLWAIASKQALDGARARELITAHFPLNP